MKRTLWAFLTFFAMSIIFGQSLKPVAEKVRNRHDSGVDFKKIQLFDQDLAPQKIAMYENAVKDVTVLTLKKNELRRIVSEKPVALELEIPFEGSILTVELVKHNIFADGFKVNTDKGYVAYTPGVYYQGIVKGDDKSVVAFSFFEDDVVGIASKPSLGNVVLAKAKNSEDFLSYLDSKLTGTNPFVCGFDELTENQKQKVSYDPAKNKSVQMT